jgi:hypothetical protein
MHNYANFGDLEFEFTISNTDNVVAKVAYWRKSAESQGKSMNLNYPSMEKGIMHCANKEKK